MHMHNEQAALFWSRSWDYPPGLGRLIERTLRPICAERVTISRVGLPTCRHERVSYPHMAAHSIGSATVSFGLVSVPVQLFAAGESKAAISFNLLHKQDGSRLQQQHVCG